MERIVDAKKGSEPRALVATGHRGTVQPKTDTVGRPFEAGSSGQSCK